MEYLAETDAGVPIGQLLPDQRGHRWPVHIGVDVGQVHDPTAIVVCEVGQQTTGRVQAYSPGVSDARRVWHLPNGGYVEHITETVYIVRQMQRLQLQTRYPDVAKRLADLVCSEQLADRDKRLYIDQTGVGRPVVQQLEDAIYARLADLPGTPTLRAGWSLQPITFTGGTDYDPQTGHMAKSYLVSRLQALSQQDASHAPRIRLPAHHREAAAMMQELRDYSLKISRDGADTYGALGSGQYDDLATALGMACLEDPRDWEISYVRVPGWP